MTDIRRYALAVLASCMVLAGCSPEAARPTQPTGGTGWTLLRAVSPTLVFEGIAAAPLGADQYLISVTVPAGGAGDCGFPTLAGFQQSDATLVAQITRSPMSSICAVVSAITFYVALDRIVIPNAVTHVAISEPCETGGCRAALP